jgi:putative transposase
VEDLKKLDKYPWSGHSVVLGCRKNPLIPSAPKSAVANEKSEMSLAEKTTREVLLHFGDTVKVARRRYRQFVKNGIDQGKRPEFQGGGLIRPACHARICDVNNDLVNGFVGIKTRSELDMARAGRSSGGNKAGLLGRNKEEREKGDERILGSGDFVSKALSKAGEVWEKDKKQKIPLTELIRSITSQLDLKPESVLSSSRRREASKARAIVSFLAVNDMGYSTTDVAKVLSIDRVSVRQCVDRGKKILDMDHKLRDRYLIN